MDQYIFITGASSGFGEATAQLFANKGYPLILMARREERLLELKEALSKQVEVITLACDVRDEVKVNQMINVLDSSILEKIGVLINNAGLAVGKGPIDEGLSDDWERMIDTNVKGLLYVTKAIVPFFKAKKKGQIINIASIAGKEVYPGGNVYCATKHAVDALSRAMRIDLVSHGIKVSNLAPGAAETEFSMVRFKGDTETANRVYDGYDPLVAMDIAETIWFLFTRPEHVNINDITVMATAQASATVISK
jgi:NADP-dependent 3-hydroxy acid dehydrogenase YdfG